MCVHRSESGFCSTAKVLFLLEEHLEVLLHLSRVDLEGPGIDERMKLPAESIVVPPEVGMTVAAAGNSEVFVLLAELLKAPFPPGSLNEVLHHLRPLLLSSVLKPCVAVTGVESMALRHHCHRDLHRDERGVVGRERLFEDPHRAHFLLPI